MFRIEVFVDDKKLVQFLNAATGLVASMTPPQPVVNVVEPHNNLKAGTGGTVPELYHAELRKKKIVTFTTHDLKVYLEKIGKSPLSYNYVIGYLKDRKFVKVVSRGNYEVLK
jgi:hypothetical protein